MVSEQSDVLCGLFLKGFDLRRVQFSPRTDDSYEDGEVELVESAVNDAAIAMIYKLNDAKFRPMFSTMIDWVTTPVSKDTAKSKIFRRISVYKFLLTFFESLKVGLAFWTAFTFGTNNWWSRSRSSQTTHPLSLRTRQMFSTLCRVRTKNRCNCGILYCIL